MIKGIGVKIKPVASSFFCSFKLFFFFFCKIERIEFSLIKCLLIGQWKKKVNRYFIHSNCNKILGKKVHFVSSN